MRIFAASALVGLLGAQGTPQEAFDPRAVAEWIKLLDDDSLDLREQAAQKLAALDPKALPLLQEAAKSGSPEAKARLLKAMSRVEDRAVLRSKLRPARLVTLEAKDRSLRDALEELAKQGTTPIEAKEVPEGEKVTLSLSKVPFWEALDGLCRANGRIMYEVGSDEVRLKPGPYVDRPRRLSGPFAAFLTGVQAVKTAAGEPSEFSLDLQACWEEGIHTDGVTWTFKEMRDDKGTDLLGDPVDRDPFDKQSTSRGGNSYETTLISRILPDAGAAKLSRLSLRVGCEFAVRSVTLEFKDPSRKVGQKESSQGVSVQLHKFEQNGDQPGGSVIFQLADKRSVSSDLVLLSLIGDDGREHRVGVTEIRKGYMQTGFSLGGGGGKGPGH
ncbi:MAG TPA: hypothetical protein VJB14_11605, partial [Planctomycetota bacterium]|nr:hypothetical protein [Planctomycetota bacterium]